MWRFYEPVEEEVSNLRIKRRRSRRRAWRDGLADQTVVNDFEDVPSYRAFERALVGSVDPRSVIELALAHRRVRPPLHIMPEVVHLHFILGEGRIVLLNENFA
jgi:hypothetical protein